MSRVFMAAMVILLALAGTVESQSSSYGQVVGIVTIKGLRTSVPNATVRLSPTDQEAQTDLAGNFTFKNVPSGVYEIRTTKDSLEGVVRQVIVRPGEITRITLEMEPVGFPNDKSKGEIAVDQNYTAPRLSGGVLTAPQSQEQRTTGTDRSKPIPDVTIDGFMDREAADYDETAKRTRQERMPFYRPNPDPQYEPDYDYYSQEPVDMFFRNYGVNTFVQTRYDRLSTFALDVDDGSYNIVKEYLNRAVMPPTDAIRVEEFINHFDYNYADPQQKKFRVFTELTASPYDPQITFLKIGIKGKELKPAQRKPLHLTFVIDVSGSMQAGNRLGLVKRSLAMLLDQLGNKDLVGIVAYGSTARVVLRPVSASRKDQIIEAVNSLWPNGSTFAEAGLKLGYEMANRMYTAKAENRIILCSDGVANVGQTSPEAIMGEIKEFANKGITLSTFGYGMGNYNDVLLEQLAIQGNGRYAYVNDVTEAQKLFVRDFVDNMTLLARDVKIQVEFDPSLVWAYRLVGYENRAVADNRFRDNTQDGGEIGPGHEVTAVYELRLSQPSRRRTPASLGTIALRWIDPDQQEVTELSREIEFIQQASVFETARPELRLAVVVSKFAELLKGTSYNIRLTYADLLQQAERIDRELNSQQTGELINLIRQARDLTQYHTRW